MHCFMIHVRGMKKCLRRDATDVEAGSAKRTTLLDTGGLQAKLSSFNGGDVAAGATADDYDFVVIGGRGEVAGEGGERDGS